MSSSPATSGSLEASHPAWIVLAHILRPQGRKGEVLAELLTDFPERFETRKSVFLVPPRFTGTKESARGCEVVSYWLPVGRNEGRIVLHLQGIDSISEAELLAGLDVVVPGTERTKLDGDSAYISDLIGCILYDLANTGGPVEVGTVTDVQFVMTPDGTRRLEDAAPLLSIEASDGSEVLVPFAKALLISVDVVSRRIEMSLPPGLIDVNRV